MNFKLQPGLLKTPTALFTDERFLKRVDASRDIVDSLRMTLQEDCNEKNLTAHIEEYQKAFEIISSLESFGAVFPAWTLRIRIPLRL